MNWSPANVIVIDDIEFWVLYFVEFDSKQMIGGCPKLVKLNKPRYESCCPPFCVFLGIMMNVSPFPLIEFCEGGARANMKVEVAFLNRRSFIRTTSEYKTLPVMYYELLVKRIPIRLGFVTKYNVPLQIQA
ncbi:hypothetical protein SUGI_0723960 [Cryptomeria japonica]|nr:hypothetical protein SUGI_0723890 [Cryptomeria japonica]GLJ36084.1 hypothetical protein SUGI_0723960 [Cryptomeria japonica]